MASISPPSQDDSAAEEPLIPMPSITPTASKAGADAAASATSDSNSISTKSPTVTPAPAEPAVPSISTKSSITPAASTETNSSLDEIKQKTLTELKPLLDEVDLPAEEKFHTILEIISATNDKELVPKLYDAAAGIEDKHERAQALVDVLSEIEYLNGEKEAK